MENNINIKVSVIVPVYNVEKYLSRCIESLIGQTFNDIEIILINDGSTDKSLNIINKYRAKDKRIKLINNENRGVSYSRNIGIKESVGEYIMFVDSDDWIDKDTIDKMYKKAIKNDYDLIMCSYVREFFSGSKCKNITKEVEIIYEKFSINNNLLRRLIGPIENELANPENLDSLGTVWGKLYKAETIKKNNIKFIDLEKIGSAEDVLFNIYLFNEINKAIFINEAMYHYWKGNSNSVTSKYNSKLREQRQVFFKYIEDFIRKNQMNEIYYEALNNRICLSILGYGLTEFSKDNNKNFLNKVKNIDKFLNDEYILNSYKHLKLKYFPIHWKIFYFFNKYRISIGSCFVILSINWLRNINNFKVRGV